MEAVEVFVCKVTCNLVPKGENVKANLAEMRADKKRAESLPPIHFISGGGEVTLFFITDQG